MGGSFYKMTAPTPQTESQAIISTIEDIYINLINKASELKKLRLTSYGWKDGVFHEFYKYFYAFVRITRYEDKVKAKINSKTIKLNGKDVSLLSEIDMFFGGLVKTDEATINQALKLSEAYEDAMYELGGISWK